MQVDVHRIDTKIAGTDATNNRVEIRTVAIDVATSRVDGIGNRLHITFKQATCVGVGDHNPSHIRAKSCCKCSKIHTAFGRCRDILNRETGESGAGRVGPMRAFGNENDAAWVTTCRKSGLDAQYSAQLSVSASLRCHSDPMHARELDQPHGQLINHRQCPLHGLNRLQGVHIGKACHTRDLFIQPRIVLHRAATQREEAQIDRIILTAQAGVMADGFRFRQSGKADVAMPLQIAQARGNLRRVGKINTGCCSGANFENQCLFKHQRLVTCEGRRRGFASIAHFRFPSALIDCVHAKISCKATANVSTSSLVTTSVTATTSPLESASVPG